MQGLEAYTSLEKLSLASLGLKSLTGLPPQLTSLAVCVIGRRVGEALAVACTWLARHLLPSCTAMAAFACLPYHAAVCLLLP